MGKAFKGCERIQTEMVSKWQWHANSKSLSPAPADGYFNRFSFKVLYCLSSWGSGHRMMGARFLSVLLSLLGLNLGLGRQCLTDGIPEDLRNFIQNDAGEKIPVGLALADWQSGIVIGKVVEILINEVLGLHAKVHPELYKTSFSAIYAVGGCLDFNHVVVEEKKCNINETQVHVVLDVWIGKVMSDLRAFETSFPSLAPEDMGSMGYSGFESMYLSRAVFERAYDAEGLALNYHLSYNTSHHNPKRYFQSISDFNVSTMVPCSNGTSFMNQHHMGDYVRWTGDLAGVELQPDGSYIGKCAPFGQPGYWWPAPACRHDTTTCIPVITSRQWQWMVCTGIDAVFHGLWISGGDWDHPKVVWLCQNCEIHAEPLLLVGPWHSLRWTPSRICRFSTSPFLRVGAGKQENGCRWNLRQQDDEPKFAAEISQVGRSWKHDLLYQFKGLEKQFQDCRGFLWSCMAWSGLVHGPRSLRLDVLLSSW